MGWRDRVAENSSKFHSVGGSRSGGTRAGGTPPVRHTPWLLRLVGAALFLLALSFLLSSPPSLKDLRWRRHREKGQGLWGSAGKETPPLPACTPLGPQGGTTEGHGQGYVQGQGQGQGLQRGRGLAAARHGVGPRIEGSALESAEEVLLFRARWECIATHHGSWVLNPTPRPIPVRDEVQEVSKNQICRRLINNSDLAPINAAVRTGLVAPASWAVPDSLKYQWQVSPQGACGAPLRPRGLPTQPQLQAGPHAEPDSASQSHRETLTDVRTEEPSSSVSAPLETDLVPFSGERLCQAFERLQARLAGSQGGSRPLEVFVVGDSLSAAFMSSLEAQMKLTMGPQGTVQVPPEGRCAAYTRGVKKLHPAYANVGEQWFEQKHYIWHGTHCATLQMCHAAGKGGEEGEGGVRVHFGRTMHLSWLSASPEAEKLFLEEPWEKLPYAWADEMVERNASVAVLNTGAFHQPHKVFLARLNFTLTLLRSKLPHLLLIYRSTSSAHLECMAFQGPIPIPRSVCGAPYHWGEFAVQNKLARRIVEDVGGVWMDVFTMTELRPDWHLHSGDCLHYCAPGPIDTWVELWMNMLQELL